MDKKAYQEKMEAQVKEWKAELDKLEARAQKQSAEAKISYQKKGKDLEKKLDQVNKNLNDLKNTSGQAWGEIKDQLETGKDDFKKHFNELLSSLKTS